jgi:AraC-like DNA-binding protein
VTARAGTAVPPDTEGFVPLEAALSAWLAPLLAGRERHGTAVLHRLGYVRLVTCDTDSLRLSRTPPLIARDAGDGAVLVLPREGTVRLAQYGRGATLTTGEPALLDLRGPFSLQQQAAGRLSLFRLPGHALHLPHRALRAVTGSALPTGRGASALLAPMLLNLDPTAGRLAPAVAERLGGIVTEFTAAAVAELTEHHDDPAGPARGHLVTAVRRYIDQHLGDPDLSAEGIAAAHGISVRYLHRLFEPEGVTVGRLIQRLRVERCERELARRGRVSPSITAVALRWGFRSPAHFSRAFKAVHGRSPRQWSASV